MLKLSGVHMPVDTECAEWEATSVETDKNTDSDSTLDTDPLTRSSESSRWSDSRRRMLDSGGTGSESNRSLQAITTESSESSENTDNDLDSRITTDSKVDTYESSLITDGKSGNRHFTTVSGEDEASESSLNTDQDGRRGRNSNRTTQPS